MPPPQILNKYTGQQRTAVQENGKHYLKNDALLKTEPFPAGGAICSGEGLNFLSRNDSSHLKLVLYSDLPCKHNNII